MSTETAVTQESAKPENLDIDTLVARAIAKRDTPSQDHVDEAVVETVEQEPVTPETPTPEAPKTGAWREVILDDVDHGFFKGKPAKELYESYRHSESAKQKAERERNEALAELQQERMARAAADAVRSAMPQPAVQPEPPKEDPRDAEIEANWFENPAKAKQLLLEKTREEQKQVAAEEFKRLYGAEKAEEESANFQRAANQAASVAISRVMSDLNLSQEDAQMAVAATFVYVKQHEKDIPDVWTNPDAYVYYVNRLRSAYSGAKPPVAEPAPTPEPAAPVVITAPPPPPEPKQPPGATKPAAITAPPTAKPSPLSEENRRIREMIGGPSLVARGERRKRA